MSNRRTTPVPVPLSLSSPPARRTSTPRAAITTPTLQVYSAHPGPTLRCCTKDPIQSVFNDFSPFWGATSGGAPSVTQGPSFPWLLGQGSPTRVSNGALVPGPTCTPLMPTPKSVHVHRLKYSCWVSPHARPSPPLIPLEQAPSTPRYPQPPHTPICHHVCWTIVRAYL